MSSRDLNKLIPQIWAEKVNAALLQGVTKSAEQMHEEYLQHQKRLAEDPDYAKQWEEFQRQEEQWLKEREEDE